MLATLPTVAGALTVSRDQGGYQVGDVIEITLDNTDGETMTEHRDTGQLPEPAGSYQVVVEWWSQDDPQQVMQSTVPYILRGPGGHRGDHRERHPRPVPLIGGGPGPPGPGARRGPRTRHSAAATSR